MNNIARYKRFALKVGQTTFKGQTKWELYVDILSEDDDNALSEVPFCIPTDKALEAFLKSCIVNHSDEYVTHLSKLITDGNEYAQDNQSIVDYVINVKSQIQRDGVTKVYRTE